MKYWNPKPRVEGDPNGLFRMDEAVEIVKKGLNPMQHQRRTDGTPYTRHGASALRPEGPALYLDDDKISKSRKDEDEKQEQRDPDEVMKAFLNHNA